MSDKIFPAVSPPVSADESMLRTAGAYVMSFMDEVGKQSEKTALIRLEETKIETADRSDQRKLDHKRLWATVGLCAGATLVVAVIAIYALFLGKDGMANDVVKQVLNLVAGGVGGYGFALAKGKKE